MAVPDAPSPPPDSALPSAPADYGQKSLVFTSVNLMSGGIQTVNEVVLTVTPGQGMVLLDPDTLPLVGEIIEGTLVICSEYFPALAPLRLQITGADMRFLIQNKRLINYAWRAGERTILRVQCTPMPDADLVYQGENYWPRRKEKRILVHYEKRRRRALVDFERMVESFGASPEVMRRNLEGMLGSMVAEQFLRPSRQQASIERRTLNIEVLRGDIRGLSRPRYGGTFPVFERLDLVRDRRSGVRELRMLASWFELRFRAGSLRQLRCFEERGLVASIALLGAQRFGAAHSVAFRDVLA